MDASTYDVIWLICSLRYAARLTSSELAPVPHTALDLVNGRHSLFLIRVSLLETGIGKQGEVLSQVSSHEMPPAKLSLLGVTGAMSRS